VHSETRQRLGNPLKLRRALEHGVTTVVAHCASLGQESPTSYQGESGPFVDNFDLFRRLMTEPQWNGKLWGDVSAMTLVNRVGPPFRVRDGGRERVAAAAHGSDYPLPAINVLMQSRPSRPRGSITPQQRALLNEIDQHDPLLLRLRDEALRAQPKGRQRVSLA